MQSEQIKNLIPRHGTAMCLSAILAVTGGVAAADSVTPARANWDTFWFGGEIAKIGLEELGFDVNGAITLGNEARYSALGSGDIDYETDSVFPQVEPQLEPYGDTVTLLGPVMNPGSVQGYLIDRKTAEKNGITHLEQLRDPEFAKIFDSDGDGLANLVGAPPGSGSELVITHHLEAYELSPTVKQDQGEFNIMYGDVIARYNAGEPVLFYAWFPNTATVVLQPGKEVVWLQVEDTKLPDSVTTDTSISDLQGCADSAEPCNPGWPKTTYYIAANSDWVAENPMAAKFLDSIRIDLPARAAQNIKMNEGEDSERDIQRHAQEWIAANQADFDSWIAAAKAVGE